MALVAPQYQDLFQLAQLPSSQDRDRHIRRSGGDYTQAFLALLPRGQAWPREPGSTLAGVVDGLSQYYGYVDGRAADLLERESDPRTTIELLSDWERAWGLPDPCFASPQTVEARRLILVLWMTWLGGQSRQYFINLMAWLGYTIEIQEFAPFMCGVSTLGDSRSLDDANANKHFRWYIGPEEQRFYWTVEVGQIGLNWFRCGSGELGVNHHLEFSIPEEAACLLQRWKPAQTELIPDFSAIAYGGPMQGTP
jgi:uncharacterized protein YmfQ (DUF2313 family)